MPKVYNMHHRDYPKGAVYIGRGSKWGNPYRIGPDGTRAEVIEKYRDYGLKNMFHLYAKLELHGRDLLCFCKPAACHGDLLLGWANESPAL